MSEKTTTAGQKYPSAPVAASTRDVLTRLAERLQFEVCVDSIVRGHGKQDALKALHDISTYMAQCILVTESDPPPVTVDHFWLIQVLYELIQTFPEAEELNEVDPLRKNVCVSLKTAIA